MLIDFTTKQLNKTSCRGELVNFPLLFAWKWTGIDLSRPQLCMVIYGPRLYFPRQNIIKKIYYCGIDTKTATVPATCI